MIKTKYIIAKHSVNGYWNYYQDNGSFILGTPSNARYFNSIEETENILQYLGIGIFKIEKVYINDTF